MSLNPDQENYNAIRILATECETLLQSLIDSESQKAVKVLFEEYLQRFSTWAAYLGVFARPSQSLDHRLSNMIDIQDLVLRGLDSLGRSLTSISENKDRFASTDIDPRQASLFGNEEDCLEIEDAIEQLYRLATAIRRSSRKTVEQRASQFADKVELKPVRVLFARTIECLYPKIDQSLQDLLSASMFDRFTKVMFLGDRQTTLAEKHFERRLLPTISEKRQVKAGLPLELEPSENPLPKYDPSVQLRDRSLAPPTSLAPSRFWQHLNAGVPNLDLNKTTSIAIHRPSYPPPPKSQRKEPGLCEWCGEPLKSRDRNPVYWRQHVDSDLKPYICLAEHCTVALGYPSFREWSSHMQRHNEAWHRTVYSPATYVCQLCIGNTSSFANRDELSKHLKSEHRSANFDDGQLSIIAGQSQGIKARPKDECLLYGFVVDNEDQEEIPSKRGSESWSETNTKRVKTSQRQPVPAASSSNDRGKDGHEEKKKEYMARHIAAHLQTLMFLTLRIISMQQGVGSEDEDAAESHAGTNDVQDDQGSNHSDEPPSFEDVNHHSELPWLPAAEPYSFNFDKRERTVFIYPALEPEDVIDPSIQLPDSSTIQETILRLEALLATTEQNRDFYNSCDLGSARHGLISGVHRWTCCKCSCGGQSLAQNPQCPDCGTYRCDQCAYY